MIGKKNRNGYIIEQMREKRKKGKWSTRRLKCIPDHLAIYSIIGRLNV